MKRVKRLTEIAIKLLLYQTESVAKILQGHACWLKNTLKFCKVNGLALHLPSPTFGSEGSQGHHPHPIRGREEVENSQNKQTNKPAKHDRNLG